MCAICRRVVSPFERDGDSPSIAARSVMTMFDTKRAGQAVTEWGGNRVGSITTDGVIELHDLPVPGAELQRHHARPRRCTVDSTRNRRTRLHHG
jgi:hypothetical protein